MPRQKQFSRKTATTYALLHRSQNDPLIHDDNTPDLVFHAVSGPSSSSLGSATKVQRRDNLEVEFERNGTIRANEGEAAEHGIYYDDTKYDYMQHMRDLGGSDGVDATWIDAPAMQGKQKGKGKDRQTLDEALRAVDLGGSELDSTDTRSLGGFSQAESMSSTYSTTTNRLLDKRRTYQDQQDVPDAIAGFQPDMDLRLREVLEALDDEAYVDDEDDIFGQLTGKNAEELDQDEFERMQFDDDENDEGWESDRTEKPMKEYLESADIPSSLAHRQGFDANGTKSANDTAVTTSDSLADSTADGDWLASFTKSKGLHPTPLMATGSTDQAIIPQVDDTKQRLPPAPRSIAPSSVITDSTNNPLRRKKRKGALTSTTNFSMSSSVLARTEPLTTLDARFERLAAHYMNDDEDDYDDQMDNDDNDTFNDTASAATGFTNRSKMSHASGMSAWSAASKMSRLSTASNASRVPQLVPAQFDQVLDNFLGGSSTGKGKGRLMRKAGPGGVWGQTSGMEQLEEIRKGLGPARMKT